MGAGSRSRTGLASTGGGCRQTTMRLSLIPPAGYKSNSSCLHGIDVVKQIATSGPVNDLSD